MSKNQESSVSNFEIKELYPDGTIKETYHEKVIRGTCYRVTSEYQGKFQLGKALEDLTIRKVLRAINDGKIE